VWKPNPPKSARSGNSIPHIYKVWKPYSPTFTRYRNHIPSHLQCAETLFPTFTEGGNLIPQFFHGVEPIFPYIYKVWKPYSTTFTKWGNPSPPLLQGVETLSPTFTECRNHIPNIHSRFAYFPKMIIAFMPNILQYVPLWTQPKMILSSAHCPVYDCSTIHTWKETPKLDLIHHQPWPLYNSYFRSPDTGSPGHRSSRRSWFPSLSAHSLHALPAYGITNCYLQPSMVSANYQHPAQ
jgi:hypothetical protein